MLVTMPTAFSASVSKPDNSSVVTSLADKTCINMPIEEEIEGSALACPGINGYKLNLYDENMRQTINVISPTGQEYPLKLWHVITRHFSSIDKTVEWRVTRLNDSSQPVAVIIRMNAQIQKDINVPPEKKSWLAVVKLGQKEICVTAKIPVSSVAINKARTEADNSKSKPCLGETDY